MSRCVIETSISYEAISVVEVCLQETDVTFSIRAAVAISDDTPKQINGLANKIVHCLSD
jgi:hypothetical protein